ncbi:MAG: hypothetical protein RLZZ337_689 [Bacteroidota bacterium]|jgi:DNA ligase-associated metallophosphoesterase
MTILPSLDIEIAGQNFQLLPDKALFWYEQEALLLADVHAGKASHFRKHGIPLSTDYLLNDLNKIEVLLDYTKAEKLWILGDLFHSSSNIENQFVEEWVSQLGAETELILGNHDVYSASETNIKCKPPYKLDSILLSHEPVDSEYFNIHGHLHPGYSIQGRGRSYLKLPAFYIGENFITLPAFGSVTGKRAYDDIIKKSKVVLITDEGLLPLG